jgi:hypothetical protein
MILRPFCIGPARRGDLSGDRQRYQERGEYGYYRLGSLMFQ